MRASIVIPAYNEATALPACLSALAAQQTQYEFEVIIVDNDSDDNTAAVAHKWQNKLNLRLVTELQRGRGRARASGFAHATSKIILSTDADSTVPKDWVETLVNTLINNRQVVAVTTSSYIVDGTRFTNWTMRIGMPLSLRLFRILIGHYMITGASFGIWKKAYEASGGFDKERDMLDDIDLSFRLARIGKIVYLTGTRVQTEGDIFRKGFIKGFWHYFKHFPPLLKKYGTTYFNRKVAKYDN